MPLTAVCSVWRTPWPAQGRGLRVIAGMVGLAAVATSAGIPFGLMLLGITGIWLGARFILSDDVRTPLRAPR